MLILAFAFRIFIAEDLTLKGKSTNFVAVVKSSKMITGRFSLEYTPFSSLVKPRRKDLPAVNTGILNDTVVVAVVGEGNLPPIGELEQLLQGKLYGRTLRVEVINSTVYNIG